MLKPILVLASLFIISCSSNDSIDNINKQNLYENNTLSDKELFELANEHIKNDKFESALIELNKIEVLFPSSEYANKSILLNAYISFVNRDYEKTRALAENYKTYYPGSTDIAYANYLEAMTYYVLLKKSDYSQKNAEEALDKFTFILNAYPDSIYEIDIITRIQVINNNLADSKLKKAKFYIKRKNYNGALLYLVDIFENHNSSNSISETLFYLSKIYFDLDEIDTSIKYASILAYNFPKSNWYNKIYNIISDIDVIDNELNWFEKYNPIKIFIENESTQSDIQVLK